MRYDANGNMTSDANKSITNISYNHLNLPVTIQIAGGTITYNYDATGAKLRKTVSSGSTTDYAGGFQYLNGNLQFFPQPEGYVDWNGGNIDYIYQYKDHLGNVRLAYKDGDKNGAVASGDILSEDNYYPFGLRQRGYNENVVNSNNKYKYNGKELQDELGLGVYKYGWRDYDPVIGRWNVIDQLSEKYYKISPYAYVANNPVTTIDPDGRYLFGLFGSTSAERRMTRANEFAEKNGGTVVMNSKGRPTVNYDVKGASDGGMSMKTKSGFGDFSSWKNLGKTLAGFDRALEGRSDGANYGGYYGGAKGQERLIEDSGKASTYIKIGGLAVATSEPITGPEAVPAGIAIFDIGEGLDKASTGLNIVSDVSKGKIGTATVRIVSEMVTGKADALIDKTIMSEAQKLGAKAVSERILEGGRDKIIEE